jgi:amphi-Trp domain-containing protein
LRDLADRLDTNEVILRKGAEELVVPIPDNVVLELKVEEEKKKQRTQRSLEIEIEWYEGEDQGSLSLG